MTNKETSNSSGDETTTPTIKPSIKVEKLSSSDESSLSTRYKRRRRKFQQNSNSDSDSSEGSTTITVQTRSATTRKSQLTNISNPSATPIRRSMRIQSNRPSHITVPLRSGVQKKNTSTHNMKLRTKVYQHFSLVLFFVLLDVDENSNQTFKICVHFLIVYEENC